MSTLTELCFDAGATTTLWGTSEFCDAANDSSHGFHNSGVSGVSFFIVVNQLAICITML